MQAQHAATSAEDKLEAPRSAREASPQLRRVLTEPRTLPIVASNQHPTPAVPMYALSLQGVQEQNLYLRYQFLRMLPPMMTLHWRLLAANRRDNSQRWYEK